MHLDVKLFARVLKSISENRKLQSLDIQGNSIIDSKADRYDGYLFPNEIGNLGSGDEAKQPVANSNDSKVKTPANAKKKTSLKKPVKKKKEQKIRMGPKINQ